MQTRSAQPGFLPNSVTSTLFTISHLVQRVFVYCWVRLAQWRNPYYFLLQGYSDRDIWSHLNAHISHHKLIYCLETQHSTQEYLTQAQKVPMEVDLEQLSFLEERKCIRKKFRTPHSANLQNSCFLLYSSI